MPLLVVASNYSVEYYARGKWQQPQSKQQRLLLLHHTSVAGQREDVLQYDGMDLALGSDLEALEAKLDERMDRKIAALQASSRTEVDGKIDRSASIEGRRLEQKIEQAGVALDSSLRSRIAEQGDEIRREVGERIAQSAATEGSRLGRDMDRKVAACEATLQSFRSSVRATLEALEASIGARVAQAEHDVELLWELHRSKEHFTDKTFLTSNYKRWYSRDHAQSITQVWPTVEAFLASYYGAYGHQDAARLASDFIQVLRAEVDNLPVGNHELARQVADDPAWLTARLWTSTETCPRLNREFCSLLNEAIRDDMATLAPHVVKIVATLAGYNVHDRSGTAALLPVQWPDDYTLHRGGRLPTQHREWYRDHIGQVVRIGMTWATTKVRDKAAHFMNHNAYPAGEPKVMYKIHLDELLLCDHVNCVEALTLVAGEQEFLFPPYSAFKVRSVVDGAAITIIELEVQSDNNAVPEGVDLVPWA